MSLNKRSNTNEEDSDTNSDTEAKAKVEEMEMLFQKGIATEISVLCARTERFQRKM
jgi:hypothetical protein